MKKKNQIESAIKMLSEWHNEDLKNRSIVVIASDENGVHVCFQGNGIIIGQSINSVLFNDDEEGSALRDIILAEVSIYKLMTGAKKALKSIDEFMEDFNDKFPELNEESDK